MEVQKVLLEISEKRLKKLPVSVGLKSKHFQAQEHFNYLKALFTKEKLKFNIFTEINSLLQINKEMLKNIKNNFLDLSEGQQNSTYLYC